jgi:hypothetical protein
MAYQITGLTSLHEFLGDFVVYRNLIPADARIPSVTKLQGQLGMSSRDLPRKAEPEYGQIVAEMLRRARAIERPGTSIERLVFIGDTQLNDGTAFRNIRDAGGWKGWAFIGRDALDQPPQVDIEGNLYVANRWKALISFLAYLEGNGFALDAGTAAIIDIDKTAIGARGRNDHVINEARVEAVQRTVAELLGLSFDQAAFERAYDELNQTTYHPFTADNQDYLAYVCLILGAGLFELDELVASIGSGEMRDFFEFIAQVQERRSELAPTGLTSIHDDVWRRVQEGDPTPFKAFRYNEYLTTIDRFGDLVGATAEQVLSQRIVITEEVRQAALALHRQGALIFALSDKPDEASVPTEAQARTGMKALHHKQTLVVGQA